MGLTTLEILQQWDKEREKVDKKVNTFSEMFLGDYSRNVKDALGTIEIGKTGEEYMAFNPIEQEVDEFNWNQEKAKCFEKLAERKKKGEVNEFNWNNNMKVPREFGVSNPTFEDDDLEPITQSLRDRMCEALGKTSSDTQVGGSHYKDYDIQPWDIIDCYGLDFYEGNVLKYLLRTKGDRLEDLQKAKHYLDKIIEEFDCGR